MSWSSRVLAALLCLMIGLAPGLSASAQDGPKSQKRIALVVGNAAYEAGGLVTPANDAGLVAQTLQAAGFDVVGARDLDEDSLRKALRDFTDKAEGSGPDTVAFVYLAGYGLQLAGENYFVPVDARIPAAADVPSRALRLSDYTRQLAALPLAARFVVLDGARNHPFARNGDPLAGGLALTEAEPGSLIAFNASPGTVGPDERGAYGAYATALVEMIREGGLTPAQVFDRVRLRVDETTRGAEVPWHSSRIDVRFSFFERAPDAPPVGRPEEVASLRARPLKEIGARDAYAVCLQRDSLDGYQEFVQAYPRDDMAKRVRALIAACASSPPLSSRRRASVRSATTCPRRRRRRSSTSSARRSTSTIRSTHWRRRRPRRRSSCRRRRPTSSISRRRRRRSPTTPCRPRPSCPCRPMSARRATSSRRPTT